MRMRHVYRLFGCPSVYRVRTLLASEQDSCPARAMASELAASGFGCSMYAPIEQPGFRRLFRMANPKLIIPLDEGSRRFFEAFEFMRHGCLVYIRFAGLSSALVPELSPGALASALAVASMSKRLFVRRMKLIARLLAEQGHAREP
ncbi:MAG: hypothetical protein ACP5GH_06665 [Nitrososphaeria archaeon]